MFFINHASNVPYGTTTSVSTEINSDRIDEALSAGINAGLEVALVIPGLSEMATSCKIVSYYTRIVQNNHI